MAERSIGWGGSTDFCRIALRPDGRPDERVKSPFRVNQGPLPHLSEPFFEVSERSLYLPDVPLGPADREMGGFPRLFHPLRPLPRGSR